MKFRTLSAVVAASMALTLSACGGPSDEDKAATALSKSLMKGSDTLKVTQKEADCVGKKMVDNVGLKDLQKYGLITKDLKADNPVDNVKMSKEDATGAADAITDCTDTVALMKKSMGSTDALDAKTKKCLDDALTEDTVHDLFVALFSGDTAAAQQKIAEPMTKCLKVG